MQHSGSDWSRIISMNESDLLKQLKNGNAEAFRFLVSAYRRMVAHIVGRIVVQPEDTEDVCQEVFLKVFRKIDKFRGESKFSTWIAAIACNTSLSYIKSRNRKGERYMEDMELAEKKWFAEDQFSKNENEELKTMLLRSVEKLPVQYRTVLTLFYLEEFSYKEIEQITGMPEGTVKSYLSRARNLLKQKIEGNHLIENFITFPHYAE